MTILIISSFLLYCIINAFTPGPGNILALNTVTTYGWQNGRPLFFGIFTGYYVVQMLCAVFVCGVSSFLPNALRILKYIGAAYILWLAFHIAVSRPEAGPEAGHASFMKGFLLQFVNVKIYLFGITALTGYITDYSTSFAVLFLCEMVIATIGSAATASWIVLGVLIQKFYRKHYRAVNIGLALTLLECIYSMLR